MNLTLDTSRYLIQPSARKSAQPGAVSRSNGSAHQSNASTSLPVSPDLEVSSDLESRARQLRRNCFRQDQISSRTQQALHAYSSITEIEERTRVSALFGLDEYA